ncbi:MAG: 50S ribosomal protein L9 [Christensenellales bacterium]
MKVILLQDVPGTGKKNQVLTVSDGYARNYLMPRKWAVEASDAAIKEIERKHEAERKQEAERHAAAEALGRTLQGKVITVKAKAGDKGRLYGSVTAQEIADALAQQHGVQLDKRKLELPEAIRNVGETQVQVTLFAGLRVPMTIKIVALEP